MKRSLNPEVWRGDGPYRWRPVHSDSGTDYKILELPDGSRSVIDDMSLGGIEFLVKFANMGYKATYGSEDA